MTRHLTIVGASARGAAQSALRAGFSVSAADLFADLDLRRACAAMRVEDYPAGLGSLLAAPQPGGWIYTGAIENYPELVDQWTRTRPLWGNPADVLLRVRHPILVAKALERAKLCAPPVKLAARGVPRDGSWLRKPLRSAGGFHVAPFHRAHRQTDGQSYFQQRIEGLSISAVYVAANSQAVLLGITRQLVGQSWTGAREFHYCGSVGPWLPSTAQLDQLQRLGTCLAHEFRLTGLFGVDAIANPAGIWPVEVNPRYTASVEVLEHVYGYHAIAMHAAACERGELPAADIHRPQQASAKAVLFTPCDLQVPAKLMALERTTQHGPWPTLADIPEPDSSIAAGWPVVTVLADGEDTTQAYQQLRKRCEQVRQCLAGPQCSTGEPREMDDTH